MSAGENDTVRDYKDSATDDVVRDERAMRSNAPAAADDREITGHHRDNIWVGMGIHLPSDPSGKARRRHRHKQHRSQHAATASPPADGQPPVDEDARKALAPGQRVMFLLQEGEAGTDGVEESASHPALFTEMEELTGHGVDQEWKETARWVKFEEDVEEGGNRWSKPHVATLSLHALFELRSCLRDGTVILDMDAQELESIVDITLDKMIAARQLEFMYRDEVRDALLRRHKHQYEHARKDKPTAEHSHSSFLNTVRSLADIGKNFSHGKNLHGQDGDKTTETDDGKRGASPPLTSGDATLSLPKVGSVPKDISREHSNADVAKLKSLVGFSRADSSSSVTAKQQPITRKTTDSALLTMGAGGVGRNGGGMGGRKSSASALQQFATSAQPMVMRKISSKIFQTYGLDPCGPGGRYEGNMHFMKKLPAGAEASNVLIGEVDFLRHHVTAFIRLQNATTLIGLVEVPVPTRFLFVLLGPLGHAAQYREIGRAMATLMSDEVFHEVAYRARSSDDLLDGIDEFLDQVTVLPPGEWDPNIRIEPPSTIPSQEKRKQHDQAPGAIEGGDHKDEEEEGGGHGSDPALKRTGKWFGGLRADIRRKVPFYLSDITDALNLQSVATFFFMYFALLAPIVTFGGLLEEATNKRMAAMENLLSGAICGTLYHVFSGQPLTIIGSTGPVLVFEKIIFDLCLRMGWAYLSFRFWVNLWMGLMLLIIVATDASSLVSYITRFTEESFATLIAVIFIYEAILKLFQIMKSETRVIHFNPFETNDTCSCIPPSDALEGKAFEKMMKKFQKQAGYDVDLSDQSWYHQQFNQTTNVTKLWIDYDKVDNYTECYRWLHGKPTGDGCYYMYDVFLMSALLMAGTFFFSMLFKNLRNSCYFNTRVRQLLSDFAVMLAIIIMTMFDVLLGVATPKLNVPSSFRPTWEGRGWFISPFGGNPVYTAPLAILPAIIACILVFMDQQITAVIVNRKENKLKKGCGYHLDLFILLILIIVVGFLGLPIYVAATVLSINHVNSLRVESESRAPGERPTFIGVREQRVTGIITFVFIGSAVFMTGVLRHIPMPVLYGVFLYMGIAALGGIQLFDRILLILMPMKYQPDAMYLRHVPIKTVHLFTLFQVICLGLLWAIKSVKSISILFPIMLVVMVGVRKMIERFFTPEEINMLDDPMPEIHLRKKEDAKKMKEAKKAHGKDDDGDGGGGEGGIGLKTVKTEAHLHIPMASGNIMKIPLGAIAEHPDTEMPINISDEVNRSGVWKHISDDSQANLKGMANGGDNNNSKNPTAARVAPTAPPTAEEEDEFEPITIKVQRPSPNTSSYNVNETKEMESQPLLKKRNVDKTSTEDEDKQESPV